MSDIKLQDILPLDISERSQVRKKAHKFLLSEIAGKKPIVDDFMRETVHYGHEARQLVSKVILWLLVAAAVLSSVRLFIEGASTMKTGPINVWGHIIYPISWLIGICTVLLAETGQIGFTLGALVLGDDDVQARRGFQIGAGISTGIALLGNIEHELWQGSLYRSVEHMSLFHFMLAVGPPITIIFGANVIKHSWLARQRYEYEAKLAYQKALDDWLVFERDVEQHDDWMRVYAEFLMDALKAKNGKGRSRNAVAKARHEFLQALDISSWKQLIAREIQVENIFSVAMQTVSDEIQPKSKLRSEFQPVTEETNGFQVNYRLAGIERVVDFLQRNIDIPDEQKRIAEICEVSPATVSRAMSKINQN